MNQTDLHESIVRRIADLGEESLWQLSHYISFLTVQFVTDGLGDSRWNWAVWGTPLLVGE